MSPLVLMIHKAGFPLDQMSYELKTLHNFALFIVYRRAVAVREDSLSAASMALVHGATR